MDGEGINVIEITRNHIRIAEIEAGKLSRRFGVPLDEARSSAYFALVDAQRRFDPNRGVAFETYFITKIRWQSFTEWRKENSTRTSRKFEPLVMVELPYDLAYQTAPDKVYEAKRAVERLMTLPVSGNARKVTGRRNVKIYEMLLQGKTVREVAVKMKLSRVQIYRLTRGYRKWHSKLLEELAA